MAKGHILAVVGAQYGSEGKGVIVNKIADRYDTHVRVGAPNAGHSFYHKEEKFVMQVIPCGWTNPEATLVLGRGMLINPRILKEEIEYVESRGYDIQHRLKIDSRAGVLDEKFHIEEGGTSGYLHQRIGSTGEGVGAARLARIRRDPQEFRLMADAAKEFGLEHLLEPNTPWFLQDRLKRGNILLEGTQGAGLSLIHGSWPYVTSTDTNAAQLAADSGVPPSLISRVLLVARTHPIRVAGNSGPLNNELTWEEMSARTGFKVEEKTTVTKKVRRIGEWDEQLFGDAIVLNRPTSVAITFMDYLSPEDVGRTIYEELSGSAKQFIEYVENRFRVPVSMIGTGGQYWEVIEKETQNGI